MLQELEESKAAPDQKILDLILIVSRVDATDDEDEEGDVAGEEGAGDDPHHQGDPLSGGLPG